MMCYEQLFNNFQKMILFLIKYTNEWVTIVGIVVEFILVTAYLLTTNKESYNFVTKLLMMFKVKLHYKIPLK